MHPYSKNSKVTDDETAQQQTDLLNLNATDDENTSIDTLRRSMSVDVQANINNSTEKEHFNLLRERKASQHVYKQNKKAFAAYIAAKMKYGEGARDDSDQESNDEDIQAELVNKTPNTKRRIIQEKEIQQVKKLGAVATGFSIFKGFVGTGILYMPLNFVNGGYVFSPTALILSVILTLYCSKLLLETRKKVGGSFSEIGLRTLGVRGKLLVDFMLATSQIGFCTAYVYFICSNLQSLFLNAFNFEISQWWLGVVCIVVYAPLCFVRKIETFAKTHVLADIMIMVTLLAVIIYASISLNNNGFQTQGLKPINWTLFPDAIGFAVYAFEGIGVIIPIQDICACPEHYFTILTITLVIITAIYILFSEYCLFVYGIAGLTDPLITASLPQDQWEVWLVYILFIVNLIFTYPLVIYPANNIIESYLYPGWPKSRKRQMCKNLNRTLMVVFTVVVAIILGPNLDKFLSVLGGFACCPIAFILPAAFHYTIAETPKQKRIDMVIVISMTGIAIFTSVWAMVTWNSG